jgi:hypothetical protein
LRISLDLISGKFGGVWAATNFCQRIERSGLPVSKAFFSSAKKSASRVE